MGLLDVQRMEAVLCIIRQDEFLLFGEQKRDFCKGLYTGFAGIHPRKEPYKRTINRILKSEVGLRAIEVEQLGTIFFHGWKQKEPVDLIVHIFCCTKFTGIPQETDKMRPKWFSIYNVPYEKMYPHSKSWIPYLIEHERFQGRVYYDVHGRMGDNVFSQVLYLINTPYSEFEDFKPKTDTYTCPTYVPESLYPPAREGEEF